MQKTIVSFLIIGLLVATSVTALTASIGNGRMVLYPEVSDGQSVTIQRSILVKNNNDLPVIIHLDPDPLLKRITTVLDNDFTLDPGAQKEAQFVITLNSGGNYEGRMLVKFSPSDPASKETPVGLTSTIIINAEGPVTPAYDQLMAEVEQEKKELSEQEPDHPDIEVPDPDAENPASNESGTVNVGVGNTQDAAKNTDGPNMVVGILIIIGIVLIGALIFWVVWKIIQ